MGRLVDLNSMRQQRAAEKAYARWPQRVDHKPRSGDYLRDIPDAVLAELAELTPRASLALYDLVLGVRNWGAGEKFPYLESSEKMEALDAFLFVADQVRFEMMRRLGWLEGLPSEDYTLLDLAVRHKQIMSEFRPTIPRLTRSYPKYQDMEQRLNLEPAAVVRSLIPEALTLFKRRVENH